MVCTEGSHLTQPEGSGKGLQKRWLSPEDVLYLDLFFLHLSCGTKSLGQTVHTQHSQSSLVRLLRRCHPLPNQYTLQEPLLLARLPSPPGDTRRGLPPAAVPSKPHWPLRSKSSCHRGKGSLWRGSRTRCWEPTPDHAPPRAPMHLFSMKCE